jgi:hypothetical protein
MLLCGAMAQPRKLLEQAEFEQHVGRENICANIQAALARAEVIFRSGSLTPAKIAKAGS